MVSLLEGELKRRIAKGFKGRLTRGILRRTVTAGLDSFGDETTPTTTDINFEGIRETFSAPRMAKEGIPDTDVGILILIGSMKPEEIIPKQDDLVFLKKPWNQWYKCRKVLEIDPAGASARLQAYEVPAP